jgi:predicted Zn-dependent protease
LNKKNLVLCGLLVCAALRAQEAPDNQDYTPEEAYYLGRAVAAAILELYPLWTGRPGITPYLNLICQAIAINSPRPDPYNGYHVTILDSDAINAFATPGGHIFITRGMAERAPSEDALAGVIAHELAHIQLMHGLSVIAETRYFDETGAMARQAEDIARRRSAAAGSALEKTAALRNAVSGIMDALLKDGYTIEQEFEADAYAVTLLAAAGYDPAGLAEMLDVLRRDSQEQRPGAALNSGQNATHPSPARRLAKLPGAADLSGGRRTRAFRDARFKRLYSGGWTNDANGG